MTDRRTRTLSPAPEDNRKLAQRVSKCYTNAVPVFHLSEDIAFPSPALADETGLLAVGGDLSVERLLLAYSMGIFPWYNRGEPILWWSPPERAVVTPSEVHLPRSLKKALKKTPMRVRIDTCFAEVIKHCAKTPRPGQRGTWITADMREAYLELHAKGVAHSFETFEDDMVVGGLFCVSLGGSFFGESMFSHKDDASKVAFVELARVLTAWSFDMIDCQLPNSNVMRYGTKVVPRKLFLELLALSVKKPTKVGKWTSASTEASPTEA